MGKTFSGYCTYYTTISLGVQLLAVNYSTQTQ